MVLYNEFNPDEEAIGEVSHADLKSRPDAIIVVGTSLKVPGIRRLAKELCAVTRGRRGGFTAWISHDSEPSGIEFKDSWDLVVKGECDEVARYVGLPRWDDKDVGDYTLVTKEDEKAKGGTVKVVLDLKPLDVVKTQGILTPGASPRQQSPAPVDGTSKPKQSKLPFATQSLTGQDLKVKKKRGRKPAASKPTNQITNVFTTTKSTKPATSKVTKAKAGNTSSMNYNAINKHSASQSALFPGLRPVSPTDHRTNSELPTKNFEIQVPNIEVDKRDQYHPLGSSSPRTPITPQRPYDRHATISPKSKPTGMESLIS
jgi:NAD-dependent histone deacetylase SIR2